MVRSQAYNARHTPHYAVVMHRKMPCTTHRGTTPTTSLPRAWLEAGKFPVRGVCVWCIQHRCMPRVRVAEKELKKPSADAKVLDHFLGNAICRLVGWAMRSSESGCCCSRQLRGKYEPDRAWSRSPLSVNGLGEWGRVNRSGKVCCDCAEPHLQRCSKTCILCVAIEIGDGRPVSNSPREAGAFCFPKSYRT